MRELERKLNVAIQNKINAAEIDSFTGKPSHFNTSRGDSPNILRHADISPDPEYQDNIPDWGVAGEVAYWISSWKGYSKVIGLCWFPGGDIKLFHGIIYPP